jgi:hypothetical protein
LSFLTIKIGLVDRERINQSLHFPGLSDDAAKIGSHAVQTKLLNPIFDAPLDIIAFLFVEDHASPRIEELANPL